MSVPEPPVSLDNSCTVIHDNTLYSYSPAGFLSIRLDVGAEWEELNPGRTVTGATCVGTTPPDAAQAGFFVVGGSAESAEYNGLQKYTYSTGEWTTITAAGEATNNRQGHGATYIKADDVLVVYGGNTGSSTASSQTFTIKASEPYGIKGYSSSAPAGVTPTLLQWSDADVLLLGGDSANKQVYLFNPTAGWRDFGASLAEPLKDPALMRVALINGDDGSKNLMTFDMTASPNEVNRVVLQDASGLPVQNSAPVRRDLTLNDWPEYNSTLAPTETRSNYAMAQGPDGMVVFSGGNAEHPIRIFDTVQNSWVDESSVLDQKPLEEESTTSTSEVATSTVASTTSEVTSSETVTSASLSESIASSITSVASTAAESASATSSTSGEPVTSGSGSEDSGLSSGTILGITLGSIVGFLLILGVALVMLRRRKLQQSHTESGQPRSAAGGYPPEKTDVGTFANDLQPPGSSGSQFRGHRPTMSQESFSSVAILMGRLGQPKSGLTRKASNNTHRSSVSSLHKEFKSTISKPMPQASNDRDFQGYDDKGVAFAPSVAEPRPRNGPLPTEDGMRRSSGWNKYWSGGSALHLLGFGGAPPAPQNQRSTVISEQSSRYSETPNTSSHTSNQNPSRITQDSATVPPLNFEGPTGISRVNSGSPVVSQYSGNVRLKQEMAGTIERPVSRGSSGYSSGIPESVNDAWDATDSEKPWGANRAPSSAYTPSFYYSTPLAPSTSNPKHPPSGVSTQPQLTMASKSSDMSWLNLGDQRRV